MIDLLNFLFNVDMFRCLQTELARDMGYAAARFGHVMFPENVYEPALECAELLLGGVGAGQKIFLCHLSDHRNFCSQYYQNLTLASLLVLFCLHFGCLMLPSIYMFN